MHELARWLLDPGVGEPGPGGRWPVWLSVVFHGSNLVIALVDFSIPLLIVRYWKFKRDGVTTRQFWRTASFFPLVGISRLVRVAAIWGPTPHLTALVDCVTAVLNLYCLAGIVPVVKHILKLPSRKVVHELVDRAQFELTSKEVVLVQLEMGREEVQAKLREAEEHQASEWWRSRKQALAELGQMLDKIGDGSQDR